METLLDILHKIKKLATKQIAPKTIAYSTEVLCKLLLRSPSLTHLICNPLLPVPEQAPVLQMERMVINNVEVMLKHLRRLALLTIMKASISSILK